jgi:hypothetical protein
VDEADAGREIAQAGSPTEAERGRAHMSSRVEREFAEQMRHVLSDATSVA